jgi:hypothetical protein
MKAPEWEVAVERPPNDLTVFKLHCGKLALKIYSKGDRVLRIEAVAHNIGGVPLRPIAGQIPRNRRPIEGHAGEVHASAELHRSVLHRRWMLDRLPSPSRVGKSTVGGIDLNKPRLRRVDQAVIALSASPEGFTASTLADQTRAFGDRNLSACQAAYDLKKLRGKQIVQRIGATRRYEAIPSGLRDHRPADAPRQSHQAAARRRSGNRSHPRRTKPTSHSLRLAMQGVFTNLGSRLF